MGNAVSNDLLGPQMAPTMSLQVIGPPSPGSKVVLWAESRLPRQTWSISELGHICSQMFEGQILDVKGNVVYVCGRGHPRGLGNIAVSSTLTTSQFHPQVAEVMTGTMWCFGNLPRTGLPRSGLFTYFEHQFPSLQFPAGDFCWDETFFIDCCCNISCFLSCRRRVISLCTLPRRKMPPTPPPLPFWPLLRLVSLLVQPDLVTRGSSGTRLTGVSPSPASPAVGADGAQPSSEPRLPISVRDSDGCSGRRDGRQS